MDVRTTIMNMLHSEQIEGMTEELKSILWEFEKNSRWGPAGIGFTNSETGEKLSLDAETPPGIICVIIGIVTPAIHAAILEVERIDDNITYTCKKTMFVSSNQIPKVEGDAENNAWLIALEMATAKPNDSQIVQYFLSTKHR